jgi:hypothetical protein
VSSSSATLGRAVEIGPVGWASPVGASSDDLTSLIHPSGTFSPGMKAREKTIPPQGSTRLPEALDRLIELYTATNRPDEVKKWQAERARYDKDAASKAGDKK